MVCMIGFPNRADAATLSGGSWTAGLPLNNLKNRTIAKVARTTDAAIASSTVSIDLGSQKNTRLISLVNHNLSLAAKYRVRMSREASATNLLTYSEQFDNAAWTKATSNGTAVPIVTGNYATSPKGEMTATRVQLALPGDTEWSLLTRSGLSVSGGCVGTLWVKAADASQVGKKINIGTFDGSLVQATKLTLTADWQRLPHSRSETVQQFFIGKHRSSNPGGLTNAETATDFLIFGSQLEAGSFATSYYPSGATPGVRPAGYIDSWQSYDCDTGWQDVWPVVYSSGALDWEDDNWWSGKYSAEQISGYTTALVVILPTNMAAQYWRIDIDDTTNAAGYLQFGRLFIGPAWSPTYNMSYGAGIGWETKTEIQQAIGGAEYFQARTPYRVARFSLDWLSEDEGMANAFEIQRRAGIDQEVFWIHDTDDTVHALRRRFLGRLRQLNPIEYPYPNITKNAFEIKELL